MNKNDQQEDSPQNFPTADLTQDLPLDLAPTETYKPGIVSSVTLIKDVSASGSSSNSNIFPILSIGSFDSEDVSNSHFEIEYEIGQGGLGRVDAATQLCFDRRVAIKRVRSDRGNDFAEKQLKEEAQLMGKLEHPAIPPVHIVGLDDDGQIALIMKFIQGNSWLDIIKRDYKKIKNKRLPQWYIEKHLNYFLRIGEALEFAHKKSIIHRDIKPENVVIGDYGEVYLIDWGIACELDENRNFHGPGYAGTPCYAAPETITNSPRWDVRSDVYLMGATLYQILSGEPPHRGASVQEVFSKIAENSSPDISNDCPDTLRFICQGAMIGDVESRYTSVHAMLEDVRYFLTDGELTELFAKAAEDLRQIRELSESKKEISDELEIIGSRCRFRLEEFIYRSPNNKQAKLNLEECLKILTEDAIKNKRIAIARGLIKQYAELIPHKQEEDSWLKSIDMSVSDLANQLVSRSDELGTGIQVKLIEEIAAQKRAYQDLRAAYIDLKKKNS